MTVISQIKEKQHSVMIAISAYINSKGNFIDLQGFSGDQLKRAAVKPPYMCNENLPQNPRVFVYLYVLAFSSDLINCC